MNTNLFEAASRNKFRFASAKGELTTEQLWDLPLQSRTGFDLDTVAKAVHSDLKAAQEESFIPTTPNPAKAVMELKLELVKHIIGVKLAERDAAKLKADKAAKRAKLLEVLADKQDLSLREKSIEELQRELAELD